MILRIALLLAFAVLAACGGGGGSTAPALAPPGPPAAPSAVAELQAELAGLSLDEFYEVSYAALIRRTPETVIWQALTNEYPPAVIGLNNLSDAYTRETYALYQVVLDGLQSFDRSLLPDDARLNYDVYAWHLQDQVDELEFIYYGFPATYSIFGVPQNTRQLFTDIHPLATPQDAEDYVSRLSAVGAKLSQLTDHLELQRNAGVIEPLLTMEIAFQQARTLAQGPATNHPFYTRFHRDIDLIPGLTATERDRLRQEALDATSDSVMAGFSQLQQTLQRLRAIAPAAIGVGQYPRGAGYYANRLQHHTTTTLTAAEIHQLGLDELIRIKAEMRLVFDQLGYPQNESLQELFARVTTDGGTIPAASALATFENIIADAESNLAQAFDIFPSADVVVIEDDFGGYYIGPSFDGSRPGAFYAGTTTDQPYYQMPSLSYHEAVPGHHTQIALSMEQQGVPSFRKLLRFTAFVEGWALYAERLAFELGWYDNDPYGNLGRLQYEALRAARLVMDTGIHSMGWSFDQATQFNDDNVGWLTPASQGAAARYSISPGQATAYMIGMLQILDARQRAMDALGPNFDLKSFHRAVLTSGAIPLALLDSVVDRYIAENLP